MNPTVLYIILGYLLLFAGCVPGAGTIHFKPENRKDFILPVRRPVQRTVL